MVHELTVCSIDKYLHVEVTKHFIVALIVWLHTKAVATTILNLANYLMLCVSIHIEPVASSFQVVSRHVTIVIMKF